MNDLGYEKRRECGLTLVIRNLSFIFINYINEYDIIYLFYFYNSTYGFILNIYIKVILMVFVRISYLKIIGNSKYL